MMIIIDDDQLCDFVRFHHFQCLSRKDILIDRLWIFCQT